MDAAVVSRVDALWQRLGLTKALLPSRAS
jgi:hypothetical protein